MDMEKFEMILTSYRKVESWCIKISSKFSPNYTISNNIHNSYLVLLAPSRIVHSNHT